MHSPDELPQKELLSDFFTIFSETCFFDHENPMPYLDLISKMCARYQKDCSFIFSTLYQLNEENLLSVDLIAAIIEHSHLTAHQLYKSLNIIHEQKLSATNFRHIAIIQMFNLEQKKIMERCCQLELFEESYSEKLCFWIYHAPSSVLLSKLFNKLKPTENDLTGIIEYAENFPLDKKFHVFIGITILEQFVEMDSIIVKLFDSCHDPLLLTELLLQPIILELIKGPQKELHLELILNSPAPELMIVTLHHIHLLKLSPELELQIKNKIIQAKLSELQQFRNALKLLLTNPKPQFPHWQVLLNDLQQSYDLLELFHLFSNYKLEEAYLSFLPFIKTIPVWQAREMLQQMLMMYPHFSYHQHFFQYALADAKDPNLSFQLYLKLLTQKIYLFHLPTENIFRLFFGANNSLLVELFLEYKRQSLLPGNELIHILTTPVLELLENPNVQQSFQFIHSNLLTKEFVAKQHPKGLLPMLESLKILQEYCLLVGYDAIKNIKLLTKTYNIQDTAEKLKKMIFENSVCQKNFEHSISQFPSIFKNCHALTEQRSVKALSKF